MSYIRISSPPLSLDLKKTMSKNLTELCVRTLNLNPEQKQQVTIHFVPINPDELAMGGTLLTDSKQPVYHVEIFGPSVNQQQKEKLASELTNVIGRDLSLAPEQIKQLGVHFIPVDLQNMFLGGKAAPQVERR